MAIISTSRSWESILEQATKRSYDLDSGVPESMAQAVRYGMSSISRPSITYPLASGSLPKAAIKVPPKNDPAGFLSSDLEQELQDQAERALVGLRGGSW